MGIGATVSSCRRYIACYRGVVFVSVTADTLPSPVNTSSMTNGWSRESDAILDATNFFGPVGSISNCFYNSLDNFTATDELKDYAVTNRKPNANTWLVPASLSLSLPALFLVLTLGWLITLVTRKIFGCPAASPASSEDRAPNNANTIVVIGADNSSAVISNGAGDGSKDNVKVIDLKQLDLEASESMNSPKVCSICFAHKISVRFDPCGHAFTCSTCSQYFVGRPCGLCRQEVKNLVEFEPESSTSGEREVKGESETSNEATPSEDSSSAASEEEDSSVDPDESANESSDDDSSRSGS